jgi:hypothetical protein
LIPSAAAAAADAAKAAAIADAALVAVADAAHVALRVARLTEIREQLQMQREEKAGLTRLIQERPGT